MSLSRLLIVLFLLCGAAFSLIADDVEATRDPGIWMKNSVWKFSDVFLHFQADGKGFSEVDGSKVPFAWTAVSNDIVKLHQGKATTSFLFLRSRTKGDVVWHDSFYGKRLPVERLE